MKKAIYDKGFNGMQDLQIDKFIMYEEERTIKMSQHLSQKSELSHDDWVIEGNVDG